MRTLIQLLFLATVLGIKYRVGVLGSEIIFNM